jgi:hypothetical protein
VSSPRMLLPFHVVKRGKVYMLGGISVLVCVCVSLAVLQVILPICSGKTKVRCLTVSLYDTHEVETLGHK